MCLCINGYVMVENECKAIDNCLKVNMFDFYSQISFRINYHTFYHFSVLDTVCTKTTNSNANVKADTHLTELIVSTLMSALQAYIYAVTKHHVLILLVVIRALVQMVIPVMAEPVLISMSVRLQVIIVLLRLSVETLKELGQHLTISKTFIEYITLFDPIKR